MHPRISINCEDALAQQISKILTHERTFLEIVELSFQHVFECFGREEDQVEWDPKCLNHGRLGVELFCPFKIECTREMEDFVAQIYELEHYGIDFTF
ncbi:hypothetical protein PI126_g22582 [Phytophthora idaei]|nr:hypothetical protein PI126_g22582 [Phytophthora idaei]